MTKLVIFSNFHARNWDFLPLILLYHWWAGFAVWDPYVEFVWNGNRTSLGSVETKRPEKDSKISFFHIFLGVLTRAKTSFLSRNYQEFDAWKMWILWKMRLWKCEFCEKWDFKNVNFVKNWDFKNVNFGKNDISGMWIFGQNVDCCPSVQSKKCLFKMFFFFYFWFKN